MLPFWVRLIHTIVLGCFVFCGWTAIAAAIVKVYKLMGGKMK